MLQFAKQQLYSLFSSYSTTQTDSFASVLSSELCSNPGAFLTLYHSGISGAPSPSAAMNRFSVKSITHRRVAGAPGHRYLEYLSVKVQDVEERASLALFIERSVSLSLPPDRINPSDPYTPLYDTSEFSSHLPPPHLSPSPRHPTGQLARDSARSQNAVDLIFGSAYARKARCRSEEVVREIKPDGLSLFELALLVDLVHKVAPIYSLFENQCFWFMKIICDVTVELSGGNCVRSYLPPFPGNNMI